MTKIMEGYIAKRLKKSELSKPNKNVLYVQKNNLEHLCHDDMEILIQIKEVFGLAQIPVEKWIKDYETAKGELKRQKRPLLIAAGIAVVTSLITIFSTKELISM